jgi:hypothetical protein
VIWPVDEPAEHKTFIDNLKAFTKEKYASGWAIMSYSSVLALTEGINKAGDINSDKVSKALLGLTFDTPVGRRSFNPNTHETAAGEFWGQMIKDSNYPFAIMKNPIISLRGHSRTDVANRYMRGRLGTAGGAAPRIISYRDRILSAPQNR